MNSNFSFVDAKYREVADPRYSDNPYIRALPALPSRAEMTRELAVLPKFDPVERTWSASERIQRLDILGKLVIPLPRHVLLAQAMHKLLITGYGPRKPFSIEQNKLTAAIYQSQQAGNFKSLHDASLAAQLSFALLGIPGAGKSYMVKQIAGMLPPAIYHPELGKWQIPYLFVEMPHDGESSHTLATSIFEELDRLLPDGSYSELYRERKGHNAEERLKKSLSIAFELGVGMVVLDEAQNRSSVDRELIDAKEKRRTKSAPKKESKLIKLLITASNVSHIPLLFVGTLELKRMQLGRLSRARRMAGRGSAQWKALTCSGSLEQMGEFEFLMAALFRYQWLQIPVTFSQPWVELFYELTQGIVDIAVKLWESCQVHSIDSGFETLDENLVRHVFHMEFITTEYGIEALRTKDQLLLQSVSDLFDADDFPAEHTEPHHDQPREVKRPARTKKVQATPPPLASSPEIEAACALQNGIGTEHIVSMPELYGESAS